MLDYASSVLALKDLKQGAVQVKRAGQHATQNGRNIATQLSERFQKRGTQKKAKCSIDC